MKTKRIKFYLSFLVFFLTLGFSNASVYFTVKLVNSPGHFAKDIIILNFDEVQPLTFNDTSATYEYNPKMATNLFILIDRSIRWHCFAWINQDKDNVQLTVDFSKHKVLIAQPKIWDQVMLAYNTYFDNEEFAKADSVASSYIRLNGDSYLSVWLLSHGAAFHNKSLKRELFKLIDPKFSNYAEYKEILADVGSRRIPKIGESFKEFELNDLSGNNFDSKIVQNKVVVIHLWTNNCGPCVRGMDDLVKYCKTIDESKVSFISIGLDEDKTKWEKAPATNKIEWTNLWQEGGLYGDLCMNYNLRAIPSFIIFDQNKKLNVIIEGEEIESINNTISQLIKDDKQVSVINRN